MVEWNVGNRRTAWLSAAIVAIAAFAACSGATSFGAPASRAIQPAPAHAPSSSPTQTMPGNAGNAGYFALPTTQTA